MGLLTPDPGLLFWMVITFGVVFFILAKYGFPVILALLFWACVYCMSVATNDPFMYFSF